MSLTKVLKDFKNKFPKENKKVIYKNRHGIKSRRTSSIFI